MPLLRIRLRTMMILVGVTAVLLALAIFVLPLLPTIRNDPWANGVGVPIDVSVVDGASGRPIDGAQVRVIHPWYPKQMPASEGTTGEDGRLRLVAYGNGAGRALMVGASRPVVLWKTQRVTFGGGALVVTRAGYEATREPMVTDQAGTTAVVRLVRSAMPVGSADEPGTGGQARSPATPAIRPVR